MMVVWFWTAVAVAVVVGMGVVEHRVACGQWPAPHRLGRVRWPDVTVSIDIQPRRPIAREAVVGAVRTVVAPALVARAALWLALYGLEGHDGPPRVDGPFARPVPGVSAPSRLMLSVTQATLVWAGAGRVVPVEVSNPTRPLAWVVLGLLVVQGAMLCVDLVLQPLTLWREHNADPTGA